MNMYLVCIFSPFIGSALAGLFGRHLGFRGSWLVSAIFMSFSFICSLIIGYEVILQGSSVSIDLGYWFSAGSVSARWGFHIDTLTVCMLFTVTLVSLCVHIYSYDYMNTDPHLPRFMSYLSLFTGFMLVLVSADNMLQMLVGWEGIGVCSYLLIGFWYHRLSATKSAVKAMLVNRVSDTFLFISIMLMWWYLGSTDYSIFLFNTKEAYYLDWICLTMMLGAAGKSAQIGLHVWLAQAMEGPTPVSALIHAATLVTAGVYIIARTNYLWECSEISRTCLTILGASTCIMAATCGFFQNDMKKVIAYSTCSQLGYMMVSLGLSNYSLGIYHLMTHACFKALLFLSAGVVIHALSDIQDVRRHGGLMQSLPWVWNTMLLGSLSLTGWPFLSGFYSKDQILELSWSTQSPVGLIAYYSLTIVVCLTSFYTFRILYTSFVSSVSTYKYSLPHVGLSAFMWVPLLILSIGSVLLGYVTVDMLLGMGTDSWGTSINTHPANAELVGYHFIPRSVTLLPLIGTILGAVLAVTFAWPIPFVTTHPLIKKIYLFFRSTWQFDVVYNNYVAFKVLDWGADTWAAIDKGVLELLGPRGISYTIFNKLVPTSRLMSTGTVHDYAIIYISTILVGIYYFAFYYNPLPISSFGMLILLMLTYI